MTKRQQRLLGAVETSIETAALRGDVPVADEVADLVAHKVAPAVLATPELQHALNSEPLIQSRVTIGAVVAIVAGLYGLALDFSDGTLPTVDALVSQAGAIAGAALVLYGRWVATKPLGR